MDKLILRGEYKLLLEVCNVKKDYYKQGIFYRNKYKERVFEDLTFQINKNEVVGLVGESGAGKSTLARLLIGLEKPSGGAIYFEGKDIQSFRRHRLKKFRMDCQLIFQDNLAAFNPRLRIIDSLREPLDTHLKKDKQTIYSHIKFFIESVGLDTELLNRYPNELSGGELQRINILRAISLRPKLLICDEILANLDNISKKLTLNLLKDLKDENGMSVLFISHDREAMREFCDRYIILG